MKKSKKPRADTLTKKTLTKADMYEDLYKKIGYSKTLSADLVNAVFDTIKKKLCSNQDVRLSGFGNFLLKDKKARKGRNPQTGNKITIKERRVLVFHPSPVLKRKINTRRKKV